MIFFFFNHGSITPKEDETFAFKKKKKKRMKDLVGMKIFRRLFIYLFFPWLNQNSLYLLWFFFFFNECMKLVVLANRELLEII